MTSAPNKKSVGYYTGLLVGLGLIGLGAYVLYLLIVSGDQTRLAVLTAAVSVATLVYTQTKNTKREVEGRHFAKKAEAYEEIITTISDLMNATRKNEQVDETELVERLADIIPKLMIWAGPEVLLAWQRMSTPSDDPLASLVAGNDLIAALRKELGHSSDHLLGPLGLVLTFIKAEDRPALQNKL